MNTTRITSPRVRPGVLTSTIRRAKNKDPLSRAAKLVIEHGISALLIVRDGKLLGVLTKMDIVRAIAH